jgi:short-subunit dehydrogenase
MRTLAQQVIWITGASSGIGEALAIELANKGAYLILSARRVDMLETVKEKCSAEAQKNIRVLPLDLTHPETHEEATRNAIQCFGHIDILINNGGITQRSLAKETLLSVDKKIMDVNYFGAVSLTKQLLPHFLTKKRGHIVTISSVTGKFGTPYRSGYAASKHALHGFFDSLRAELWKDVGNAITITLVAPGFIHTPITYAAVTGDGTPLGKMDEGQFKGKPADWCAQRIVKAIEQKKDEVYIGGREVFGVYIKRLLPSLFARIIRKTSVR